ncbi:hypothetical protein QTN25_008447 [Entamoeba marina]
MSSVMLNPTYQDSEGNSVKFFIFPIDECFKYSVTDVYYARVDLSSSVYKLNAYKESTCETYAGYYGTFNDPSHVLDGTVSYDGYYYEYEDEDCNSMLSFPKYNKVYYLLDVCGISSFSTGSIKYTQSGSSIYSTSYSDSNCQTETSSKQIGVCSGTYCNNGYMSNCYCTEGSVTGTTAAESSEVISSSEETPVTSSSEETPVTSSSEETPVTSSSEKPVVSSSSDNTDPDYNNGSDITTILTLIVAFISYAILA